VSERVLTRLDQTHTIQVRQLSESYLEGLALALVDAMVREDIWQVFDVLDRSQRRHAGVRPTQTIVSGADGQVIASSTPRMVPLQTAVPAHYRSALGGGQTLTIAPDRHVAFARHDVVFEGRQVGTIYATLDLAPLIAERAEIVWTLIVTNAALTGGLALIAWLVVGRMMRPVQVLADHLESSSVNRVAVIPDHELADARPEYRRTFAAYNRLAKAMIEREAMAARLAEEERLASLGRLASGMAHEINNPLGGLFNVIDTMKRHGAEASVRVKSLDLIERGLTGIRDVVRATLMTYRAETDRRMLRPEDVDDLELLLGPEAQRRGIFLTWTRDLVGEFNIPASTLRQIAINLVLNACQASPRDSWVNVFVSSDDVRFQLVVEDEGPGLPAGAAES
jgi:signal transduction histidine kinase